jgi:hypothetical protein
MDNNFSKTLFIREIIKISFIINMIKDGWSFRHISDRVFEFKKKRSLVGNIDIDKLLGHHFKNIAFA